MQTTKMICTPAKADLLVTEVYLRVFAELISVLSQLLGLVSDLFTFLFGNR